MAKGGRFLAGNAPLGEQAKNLSESAVHAGGGGEVAAGGIKFGKIECATDDVTSGRRIAKQLFFSFGMKAAQGGMNVGAGHGALASVGESELAALRERVGIDMDFFMRQKRRDWHALLALDNLIILRSGARVDVVIVGRELVGMKINGILDKKRKRRNDVCSWFLCDVHTRCYQVSTQMSTYLFTCRLFEQREGGDFIRMK